MTRVGSENATGSWGALSTASLVVNWFDLTPFAALLHGREPSFGDASDGESVRGHHAIAARPLRPQALSPDAPILTPSYAEVHFYPATAHPLSKINLRERRIPTPAQITLEPLHGIDVIQRWRPLNRNSRIKERSEL